MSLPPYLAQLLAREKHLGWVPPRLRTQAQNDAHARATARHVMFGLAPPKNTGPVKVVLTDFWSHPLVVADLGFAFTGFYQFTGSCVGVSTGDAVATLGFIQRTLATNPTKAFVPFWPFDYGQCRLNEGDHGQGEGAVDSVMGQTISGNGVLDSTEANLPTFNRTSDGFQLSQSLEMTWSDGAYSGAQPFMPIAKQWPVGGIATLNNVADIKAAILNGYPVLDGCDNYIGNGSVQGSGADAACIGQYDGAGGHSTCYLGYWDNPTFGPLYLYSNQWATSTYQTDPGGGGRCCVWVKEATVAKLFQTGGSGGETMALSHLTYFPAQPAILDFFDRQPQT